MITSKQQLELQLAIMQDKHDKLSSMVEQWERDRDRLQAAKEQLIAIEKDLALTMALQALRSARASNEMNALQLAAAKRKITEVLERKVA